MVFSKKKKKKGMHVQEAMYVIVMSDHYDGVES